MDLTNDMEISLVNHKSIYLRLGIVILLHLMKVSGVVVKRQLVPSFVQAEPNHIVVHRGETAVLKCVIRNLGPRSVAWRKVSEDFPLTVGGMMYAQYDEMSVDFQEDGRFTNNTLIIKNAKPSHTGTYECQISSADIYTYHVHLEVLKTRKYIQPSIKLTGTLYPSPNQVLNLTCNATSPDRTPQQIDWFHNGNLIDERKPQWKDRTLILNYVPEVPGQSLISQLSIKSIKATDAGIYVCRSMTPSSDMAVSTTSVMVNVLNAEKDIKKREESKAKDSAKRLHHQRNNNAERLCVQHYIAVPVLLLYSLIIR